MDTDGGGWMVFQRRQDGSVDFYRTISEYSAGFGSFDTEFWLGNDILHRMTAQGEYELRVVLSDWENVMAYALYHSFSIADRGDKYRLAVGGYHTGSTAGDSLSYHNDLQFSTKDLDNDGLPVSNCAQRYHGAWWYNACHESNLNGEYHQGPSTEFGIIWKAWRGMSYSLKTTEMKIRAKPKDSLVPV
ncbi:ficolin-1-like [Asterias amurensis]|uniref:ficolin-1-like n=1 Tax=Asterias amurensis TaxID=7602 RepID=UPI003AB26F96